MYLYQVKHNYLNICIYNRLLRRFAPIFVYIVKQNQNFKMFHKFYKDQILLEANFWNIDHSLTFPGAM